MLFELEVSRDKVHYLGDFVPDLYKVTAAYGARRLNWWMLYARNYRAFWQRSALT
jgi:hypothetical protein